MQMSPPKCKTTTWCIICNKLTQQQLQPGDVDSSCAQETSGAHRSGPSSDFAASAPPVYREPSQDSGSLRLRPVIEPPPSRQQLDILCLCQMAHFGEGDLHAYLHFALHRRAPNGLEASADPAGR